MVDEIEDSYFSEREGVVPTAEEAEIGQSFWAGFVALISQRIGNNGFAESFPLCCSDTGLPHDTDVQTLGCLFSAEIHSLKWPLDPGAMPQTAEVLDSAEFFWRHVSEVTDRRGHSSRSWGFQHYHFIAFDRALGRSNYRSDVNRLLRRCAHPYFLDDCGKARRRLAPTVQTIIRKTHFRTGDAELDRLLVEACEKFESPDLTVQREALERLWDSWERLKSLMLPDKADSTKKLLDEFVAEPQLRQKVESDARDLTWIGNNLMIRHSEVSKPQVARTEHVDYLFLRLFALMSSILKARGWTVIS